MNNIENKINLFCCENTAFCVSPVRRATTDAAKTQNNTSFCQHPHAGILLVASLSERCIHVPSRSTEQSVDSVRFLFTGIWYQILSGITKLAIVSNVSISAVAVEQIYMYGNDNGKNIQICAKLYNLGKA